MIPTESYFDPSSGEKNMFEALRKLPDDYYVFHSYRVVRLIPDKGLNENEIDFLVFNPKYGCLFIECKNSKIKRTESGDWKYIVNRDGEIQEIRMKDPFNQAFSGQHNLYNKLRETYPEYKDIINRCKFMIAVWLPKYSKEELAEINLGPNITKELIMTKEALESKAELINQIEILMNRMNKVHLVCKYEEELLVEDSPGYKHSLSIDDAMRLYNNVLCPTFKTIVNIKTEKQKTYVELLEEQFVALNFLEYQRTAAINGACGTGKTLIAIERARRVSNASNRVLFICYNRNLKEWLARMYGEELTFVDFYTLDGYGCKTCNVGLEQLNYYDAASIIEYEMKNRSFKYKHIIVDEGQDFGRSGIDNAKILELFSGYGSGSFGDNDTSFFVFYDKNQLVNSKKIPVYLDEVDSKLTLYKNCRNTKNIADTAYSLLNIKPIVDDRAWNGESAKFVYYEGESDFISKLNNMLDEVCNNSDTSKVIVTCSESIEYSTIYNYIEIGADGRSAQYQYNGENIGVYTSATYKGLEADDVIVIDVNNRTFEEQNKSFYVAASRGKNYLIVFIDEEHLDIENVVKTHFPNAFPNPNKKVKLAMQMHAIYHMEEK